MHQAAVLHKWAEIYSAIFLPAKRLGESSLGQNMPKYKGIREIKWCFDIVYRKLSLQRVPLLVIYSISIQKNWKQYWKHWKYAAKHVPKVRLIHIENLIRPFIFKVVRERKLMEIWRIESNWLVIFLLEFSWEKSTCSTVFCL